MLGSTASSSFQPTRMQDFMLRGKSCSHWSKCGGFFFSLPLMEFPFLFLNLNENGILPIFSHDCGANLNFHFESFQRGKMKVKLCKPREQMHLWRESDSNNCRALLEAETWALSKQSPPCSSNVSSAPGEDTAKPDCCSLTGCAWPKCTSFSPP